jgi:peptidoglycan/LPS O-acetylase OafA/YrhL
MSDLAMGAMLAYVSFSTSVFKERLIKWWTRGKTLGLYVIFAGMIYIKTYGHSIVHPSIWNFYSAILPVIFSIIFALIIFEQNYSTESIFKVGDSKLFTYLGKISYGLYAYHLIALAMVATLLSSLSISSPVTTAVLTFALTVALAHLSYKYVEKRVLKLKGKFQ